jgi:hypothetical protein
MRHLPGPPRTVITIDPELLGPFHVPPKCQGQIIEFAFAAYDGDGVVRRTIDLGQPDSEPEYYWGHLVGDFEPWNDIPEVEEWQCAKMGNPQ